MYFEAFCLQDSNECFFGLKIILTQHSSNKLLRFANAKYFKSPFSHSRLDLYFEALSLQDSNECFLGLKIILTQHSFNHLLRFAD